MLTELKRCNSIGNVDGILFLVSIMAGKERISRDEIRNRCALENNITVNCPGAVAFFEYLGLVDTTSDTIMPLPELDTLAAKSNGEIIEQLAAMSINRLVEEGIFDKDATGFDAEKGHLTIKRSAFHWLMLLSVISSLWPELLIRKRTERYVWRRIMNLTGRSNYVTEGKKSHLSNY